MNADVRFHNASESALVVEFGSGVDPRVNGRVLLLDEALIRQAPPGIEETVPTYRSLMIHYDPIVIGRQNLIDLIRGLLSDLPEMPAARSCWTVPCCYDGACAEDMQTIVRTSGLTTERIVALHSGAVFRAYMYGFAPGFCYLGGLPKQLAISRRANPRPPTPSNVILIGGGLCLISTFSMPTGWWIIGRTPENMFSIARDPPFLVEVGDEIRFEPVDHATFTKLSARVAEGETVARRVSLA